MKSIHNYSFLLWKAILAIETISVSFTEIFTNTTYFSPLKSLKFSGISQRHCVKHMPKLIFIKFDMIRKMYLSFDPIKGYVTQIFKTFAMHVSDLHGI